MITSALISSAPATGAAPQDAVQGRGGKDKSDDFDNALSSVSQRQSKGQDNEQSAATTGSPSADPDGAEQTATSNARISIAGMTTASAGLRIDLAIAGKMPRQAEDDTEKQPNLTGDQLKTAETKTSQQKTKAKAQEKAAEDEGLSDKAQVTDGKVPDVANVVANPAEAKTATDGVNSALSLLTGSAEAAALANSAGKTPSSTISARANSGDGKGEAIAAQSEAAVGKVLPDTELDPVADLPSGEPVAGEKTFRFAGPRGSSMDMVIGAGADGKTTFETGRSGNGNAEQVTVLDARRFLGFSQSTNGAALTNAISQDQNWAAAMHPSSALSNAAAQSSTGNVVNTLKIQMTPVDLGSVTATLRLVGEQLSVHLTVETRAAHSQLTSDSSSILEALRSQGFAVDQVTVTITPTSQSDNSQQANDPGQRGAAQGQQGNGGTGQQGQQSSRSDAPFMTGNEDYETAADPRLGAASGRDAASDDIYL